MSVGHGEAVSAVTPLFLAPPEHGVPPGRGVGQENAQHSVVEAPRPRASSRQRRFERRVARRRTARAALS
jgi:hypothetical protein